MGTRLPITELGHFVVYTVFKDFPGGPADRSPPANAGDTGSSPGPGGFHMPPSDQAFVPQLLSLRAAIAEAHGPRPVLATRGATAVRGPCSRTTESPPLAATRESLHAAARASTNKNINK